MALPGRRHRRVRANGEVQILAVLELACPSGGIDGLHRGSVDQPQLAWKCRESVGENVRDPLQSVEVARAAVDGAPYQHLLEHRLGRGALDRTLFVAREAHCGTPLAVVLAERHTRNDIAHS
jgi:hypothetical protein